MAQKRWVWRATQVVVIALLVGAGVLFITSEKRAGVAGRDLADALAEADRTDPDWKWDDLAAKRPRPPHGKNAADLVARFDAAVPSNWGVGLSGPEWEPAPPPNTRHRDELVFEARAQLAAIGPAVELARSLKDYPEGFRDIELADNPIGTLLNHTQATRMVAYILKWDTIVAVEVGDRGRAVDNLVAMLNASRSIGDEPTLISQLVRIACRSVAAGALQRVLAHLPLTDPELARLQAAWAADADEPLLLYALRGERAMFDTYLRKVAAGIISDQDIAAEEKDRPLLDRVRGTFRRKNWAGARAASLRWYNQAVEAARRPVEAQPAALRAIPTPPDPDREVALALGLAASAERVAGACWRSAAEARCVVVALACERFRLKIGRWPNDLAELPPDLLPGGVLLDPFDGKPLRYKRLDDGVVVYSIGQDGADDGGAVDTSPPKDTGVRLWDPPHRRKPAPPPEPPEVPDPPGPGDPP
jgi:hypothetical protein